MGFFNPWFLLGLAALGLPVYLHLLRRHVTTPVPFSSLMFFERGIQSSTRHQRLRYLLLFSLRAALLLLLVLAFANPFIRRASAGVNDKLLLLVVDDSFSMKAGSRFADAKQAALQVLASRPRSQPAEVMALGGRLAILTQPIEDEAALRSAVESIQPGDARAFTPSRSRFTPPLNCTCSAICRRLACRQILLICSYRQAYLSCCTRWEALPHQTGPSKAFTSRLSWPTRKTPGNRGCRR